jgi:phosphoglycolate phosphatase-like HAD superfamily hydrolase
MMGMRRIVMFDFDGTLADTMPDLVDALIDTLGDRLSGDEPQRRDQVMHLIQRPPREMLQSVAELSGWQASEIQSKLMTLTARLPARLFPEVPAVLRSLKQSGFRIVISSNNPDSSFGDRLAGVGLTDQCDFALGTDREKGISKEDHPRIAAERLGVLPEELAATGVFVADLPGDMQLARNAGLLAIGRVTGTNAESMVAAGAQQVITDLTELEPLLNSLNAATEIEG